MVAEKIKKNQEHANMEHVKSKGTDLQNTKTFKFKTQRTQTQTQPSISSKPRTSHEKSNPPHNHQT